MVRRDASVNEPTSGGEVVGVLCTAAGRALLERQAATEPDARLPRKFRLLLASWSS